VALDSGIELRLRVERLVGFVMAEAAVADQVNHDVVAELLTEGESKPDCVDARLDVVRVDVNHRYVKALGDIRRPAG
jgi:hypothetical protein